MTDFNTLTPHTAKPADIKRALIRSLLHEEWELITRYGWLLGRPFPVLKHRTRPVEVRVRSGAVYLHGVKISGFNHCLAKQAKWWVRRHLFSDLVGASC